jgi:hypothetical protein
MSESKPHKSDRPYFIFGSDKVKYHLFFLYRLISNLIYLGLINFGFSIFIDQNNYIIRIVRVQILLGFGPV